MSKIVIAALLAFVSIASPRAADAQPLLSRLGALLTEQKPLESFVPDPSAAAATTATVASLFEIELATLPISTSSGGFVYRLSPTLGTFERASNEFGPIFTERALRNSRGQASFGFTLQIARFGSLQGADLTNGTFPTNAERVTGAIDPFSVDTLKLNLESRTATTFVTYGVTDRLSVAAAVPIVTVRFSGQRMRTVGGQSALQSVQAGSASGLGDIVGNGRYLLLGTGNRGVSVGTDLHLPTGNQANLLGTEDVATRLIAIGSWEDGQLAVHLNSGVGFGGVSREAFWNVATTFAATDRVTVIGEFMGRRLSELSRVSDVYQPHPVLAGVETMRWLPTERGINMMFLVAGAKWNVARSCLLNTSVLIRTSDAGLRARVTPSVSFDYAFER